MNVPTGRDRRNRGSVLPDLSRVRSLELDQDPVLVNGMKVVFDERVGVFPVELEKVPVADPHGDGSKSEGAT